MFLCISSTTPGDSGNLPASSHYLQNHLQYLQPQSAEQMPSGFSARRVWSHSRRAGWQVHSRAKRPRIFAVSSSLQRLRLHCYLTEHVHTARLPMCSVIWNFSVTGQVRRIMKNSRMERRQLTLELWLPSPGPR